MNLLQRIQRLVMSAEGFQFAVYDLAGGGKIECDTETLEIGSVVSLVKEDDSKELAPSGPHTLADGRTIVLDDASKVTEIKEADAPTATEEEMAKKKAEKMALELDPELVQSVEELIKEKMKKENFEEDLTSLASELIQVIVSYDEELEELAEEKEEDSTTEIEDMKKMFNEMSKIVYDLAKTQEKFSEDLSKVPSAKPVSQIEFTAEPEVIDPLAARIEAIKNLNK